VSATLTQTISPSDWCGPLNAGSGCLDCLPVALRGQVEFFARSNALEGPRNCAQPPPVYIETSSSSAGGGYSVSSSYSSGPRTLYNAYSGVYCEGYNSYESTTIEGDATASTTTYVGRGSFSEGNNGGPLCAQFVTDTTTTTPGPGGSTTEVINTYKLNDWVTYSDTTTTEGDVAGGNYTSTRVRTSVGDYTNTTTGTDPYTGGTITYTTTFSVDATWTQTTVHTRRLDEDTQEEADDEVEASESSPDVWGETPDEQFPRLYDVPLIDAAFGTMDPQWNEHPAQASVLLPRTSAGRFVLRARFAIPAAAFPGQTYAATWAVVTRRLGWGVARSGTAPGRTETNRSRLYTLTDPMSGPEDDLGPLAFADASWGDLGYSLLIVPYTPPAPAPGAPANRPTSGLRVAGRLRRSRLRFATLAPGLVTFKLRRLTVLDSDPAVYTTSLAEVTAAGTLAADGTNSTDDIDYAPPDRVHSVYLFVDEVRDAAGRLLPDEAWIAPGKVRDGWLGFLQLDHAAVQADSVFYRRRTFRQETSVTATYSPDPEAPPSEEDEACYGSTGEGSLPFLDFTQTQVWEQVAGLAGVPDWSLASADGSCGEQTWTGEVSPFDPPGASPATVAMGWTLGASTASRTDPQEPAAGERNGALWANWARVEPVANPRFGGETLDLAIGSSGTSAATYTEGVEPGSVQQTGIIYLYAAEPGRSVQLVNLHVRGS
jgi:hypothetical protein